MKRLLLSLGLIAVAASSSTSILRIKHSSQIIKNNSQVANYEQYKTKLVAVMNVKISSYNEEKIKAIILDSLSLVNGQIYVNVDI